MRHSIRRGLRAGRAGRDRLVAPAPSALAPATSPEALAPATSPEALGIDGTGRPGVAPAPDVIPPGPDTGPVAERHPDLAAGRHRGGQHRRFDLRPVHGVHARGLGEPGPGHRARGARPGAANSRRGKATAP